MKIPFKYKILYKLGFTAYADRQIIKLLSKEFDMPVRILTQEEFDKEEAIRQEMLQYTFAEEIDHK